MQRYNGLAQDRAGNCIASATINVYTAGTLTPATLFSDNSSTPLTNPFTGNVDGTYAFYAANGRYDIVVTRSGYTFPASETADELFQDYTTLAVGSYGSVGLVGTNNAVTPNTKYDFVADVAVVRRASTGAVFSQSNTGTITNDVGLAGPAVNGRDQAGAFAINSWIYFYWIYNGVTFATVSSATAPPTGPALPSGYTHWGYIHANRFSAASQLVPTRVRGSWVSYVTAQNALALGSSVGELAVSLAAIIPPAALNFRINGNWVVTYNNAADGSWEIDLRVVSGSTYVALNFGTVGLGANHSYSSVLSDYTLPNIGQQFIFLWPTIPAGGAGQQLTLNVTQYQIPNGGV